MTHPSAIKVQEIFAQADEQAANWAQDEMYTEAERVREVKKIRAAALAQARLAAEKAMQLAKQRKESAAGLLQVYKQGDAERRDAQKQLVAYRKVEALFGGARTPEEIEDFSAEAAGSKDLYALQALHDLTPQLAKAKKAGVVQGAWSGWNPHSVVGYTGEYLADLEPPKLQAARKEAEDAVADARQLVTDLALLNEQASRRTGGYGPLHGIGDYTATEKTTKGFRTVRRNAYEDLAE